MKKVCIIGGANIDIYAQPHDKLIIRDSNPSNISFHIGGVGCNVARNLALLGVSVSFVSVFGNDAFSHTLINSCQKLNMDISKCLFDSLKSSVYLCINDKDGDMYLGANDMNILNRLNVEYMSKIIHWINGHDACVFDTNLSEETINYLIENVKIPLFLETVSVSKCNKLSKLPFMIKSNKPEAEYLSGITVKSKTDLKKAADEIVKKGAEFVVITLGAEGSFYTYKDESGIAAAPKDKVINTTGAGDAFFAGVIYGYLSDEKISACLNYGTALSSFALNCESAVNEKITKESFEAFLSKSVNI